MRILIISNYFYPAMNARAFRWGEITRRWSAVGNEVEVVSRWMPGSLTREVKDGVVIHRVGKGFFEFLRGAREADFNRSHCDRTEMKSCGVMKNVRKLAKYVHDLTWKKIYWPDFGCLWLFSAKKKALELFKAKGFDAIVSVAPPFSSHLVAFLSRKRLGNVPWVVDIGDPFCFMRETPVNNMWLYSSINVRAERAVFRNASFVTVTTQKTAERYAECFPESRNKIIVIPPMVSLWTNRVEENRNVFNQDKIILTYIGTLIKGTREPDHLLQIIRSLVEKRPELKKTLELHFFGDTSMCKRNFDRYPDIKDSCITHGMVARNQIPQILADSDILVNIGNATNYQLPSKIVEYIYSGKPIINICSTADDTSADVLKNHPLAINILGADGNVSENAHKCLVFIDQSSGKELGNDDVNRMVSDHTADVIIGRYFALLK